MEQVQQLAGHSDIRTTQMYYASKERDAEDVARHTYCVSLAFSPDGTQLAAGSAPGIVLVWDEATGPAISNSGRSAA